MFTCCFSNVQQTTLYPTFLLCTPARKKLSPFHSPFQLAAVTISLREHLRTDLYMNAGIGRRGSRL
jgi:hypothetical protein